MGNILTFWIVIVSIQIATAQGICGKQQSAHQLVFGGSAVTEGEWPWVVSLFEKRGDQFFCSANLISHQHLLTGKKGNFGVLKKGEGLFISDG